MTDKYLFPIEDWWDERQIEIVEDQSRVWIKRRFSSTAGFWTIQDGLRILRKLSQHDQLPPGAIIDDTAWDHEHCALCMSKISEFVHDHNEGFFDGKEWICPDCYEKHILPRKMNISTK
jgi:hypothetical protein